MINILIVGVGGQGTLLASRVLGNYALKSGFDCKLSEVHGMAQRGGSVVTHVRMGEEVFSPVICEGGADIVVAFERLEAARYANYLKSGGIMLVNAAQIPPLPVITGAVSYPQNLAEKIKERDVQYFEINASKIAEEAGSARAANVVMLSKLAALLKFDMKKFEESVLSEVPEKAKEINKKALKLGVKN